MKGRLLIDLSPLGGGHGQRGIAAYVGGLVRAIEALPTADRELVWAVGQPGPALAVCGPRSIAKASLGWNPRLAGPLTGYLAARGALSASGSVAFHATDPFHAWLPGGAAIGVTVYDLIPLRFPGYARSMRRHRWLRYRAFLRAIRRADRVFAISHTSADDVAELLDVPRDRIDVVYPIVDLPTGPLVRTPTDEPSFIAVGALDPHKQPELAVLALVEFRRTHGIGRLRFIGPATEAQSRDLLELARRHGIDDAVTIEGRVPHEVRETAYRTATALLSTSYAEGFGLPGVEAAARGVPVIAVDIPAARETLGGIASLVEADPRAIADAMASPLGPTPLDRGVLLERFSAVSGAAGLAAAYGHLQGES